MPATLHEVAAKANVSYATVSLALSGKGRLSDKTRERVKHIAREMGYRPNSAARATQSGRFNAAALILPAERGWFAPGWLLESIHGALDARQMHLVLSKLPSKKITGSNELPHALRYLAADGMLMLNAGNLGQRAGKELTQAGSPIIWLNEKLESDCVHPDDVQAGHAATQRLVELGHQRITLLRYKDETNDSIHYSSPDRQQGYSQVMRQAGLTPDVCEIEYTPMQYRGFRAQGDHRLDHLHALLRGKDRPTAIVACGQNEAIAIHAATAALGMKLGTDLSLIVTGWGYLDVSGLPINCCSVNADELGQVAVQMLCDKLHDPSKPLPPRTVEHCWFDGLTVGAPASP